jgi:hypothetical protein
MLEYVRASDFGITRRVGNGSVQARDYVLPSVQNRTSVTLSNNVKPDQPFPNIARLVAFDKKGQSFGSCSYIGSAGNYGVIVSNWHVICEADGLVHVYFPSGFSSFGAIIQIDRKWDLAVIVISKPPVSIQPLPIMQTAPRPGEPLWIAGYGSGSYRIASGYCVEYLAPEIPRNGAAPSYEIIKLSTTARQGDSGGPILNKNGELAGVLFGSDMVTSTAGSHCERVKWFLKQSNPVIANLPQKPEALFASIEPDGPRHQLSNSQQNTNKPDSILQARNFPATAPIVIPPEKAVLKSINNNNNTPKVINNTNNTANEKENFPTKKPYNKSAQNKTSPNKTKNTSNEFLENRPVFVVERSPMVEKPPNEQGKTIEWAYNYNKAENKINSVTKNLVVPMANFQVIDETPETNVAMAVLHFVNDPNKKTETTSTIQNIASYQTNDNETVLLDGGINGETLRVDFSRVTWSRKYVVGSVVVIFSMLFYLSLRFLRMPDNEKQSLQSIDPELISIETTIIKNDIVEYNSESEKNNFADSSQKNYRKHRKKAA